MNSPIATAAFILFCLTVLACMVLIGSKRIQRDLTEANKDPVRPSPCFADDDEANFPRR